MGNRYDKCYTSTEACIHARRCFMTGEYCSKQTEIQRERKKRYKKDSGKKEEKNNEKAQKNGDNEATKKPEITITAFVIMNFSDMSKVVYKWRLRPFIESLSKYLYMDTKNKRLYCVADEDYKIKEEDKKTWCKVKEIRVVRADSDTASNYVICSRICQQMQIADLVIVDVSSQNANVFYEFGMAVALGKLILPICYSESFYKMTIPEKLEKDKDISKDDGDDKREKMKHHLGCYPWRKRLFEYYGIRQRNDDSETVYFEFEEATDSRYGFSDIKYARFPYHEALKDNKEAVGKNIYDRLKDNYNNALRKDNTLVVYTMDGFQNGDQAGQCIVNFYHNITLKMQQEQCFCGERVGVLVQENVIPENEKDSQAQLNLFYSVGEIIHIGVNQATYMAAEEKIKTSDGLKEPEVLEQIDKKAGKMGRAMKEQKDVMKRFVKRHIRNRGMLVYPNNPVYVNRMKNHLQDNLLERLPVEVDDSGQVLDHHAFCLYHVMLRTLRYTNEIVVDITDNCLQALFWLGAAHGSDVHAITVRHEKTDKEKEIIFGTAEKHNRNVFDVAGLWTAIFHSNDTEGFYEQLALAQLGIERHSKLMVVNSDFYKKDIKEYLFSFEVETDKEKPKKLLEDKRQEEKEALESYYRNRFWNPMLRYNKLGIYLPQRVDESLGEPRVNTAKWDFDAVSALSHYLSKRTVIGEYHVKALSDKENEIVEQKEPINFICVGSSAKPLGESLTEYIYKTFGSKFTVHQRKELKFKVNCGAGKECVYKGFECLGENNGVYTQHPQSYCAECNECLTERKKLFDEVDGKLLKIEGDITGEEKNHCYLVKEGTHEQIAQLVLWRENPRDANDRSYFRVAFNGSSGPATFGLSALFVDKEQKQEYFDKKNWEESSYLLCELQENVRGEFMKVFLGRLDKRLEEGVEEEEEKGIEDRLCGDRKNRYFSLVKHAVSYYLSTVLYRYFLPFLSEKDINRIYNGMHMYICSMRADNESPFALSYPEKGDPDYKKAVANEIVNKFIKIIPEVLLETLKGFRGLEVFYLVEVSHDAEGSKKPKKDTRGVKGIKMLQEESLQIHCFFDIS